jgi:hypothetical protein
MLVILPGRPGDSKPEGRPALPVDCDLPLLLRTVILAIIMNEWFGLLKCGWKVSECEVFICEFLLEFTEVELAFWSDQPSLDRI